MARQVAHALAGAVWGAMKKPAKVVHVSGLRRSGNHACINWLANAIYGENVRHHGLGHYLFRSWPHGRVVFINSYAQERASVLLRELWKHRDAIARCEYLFLGLEDAPPAFTHFLLRGSRAIRIHVDRSIFNTMASRAKMMDRQARKGHSGTAVDFSLNAKLLEAAFADRRSAMLQWNYDQWLQDPAWRKDFLAKLGLVHDILPDMSTEGGGSSFTGSERGFPAPGATARFLEQPVPQEWLTLVAERFGDQLTQLEQAQWELIRNAGAGPHGAR